MTTVKIRHLVALPRKGGYVLYFWQPTAALKAAGFASEPLGRDKAKAYARAEELNGEVDAWRRGMTPSADPKSKTGTLDWLIDIYKASGRYQKLRPKTRQGYDQCIRVIRRWVEPAKHLPAKSITPLAVEKFRDQMKATPSQANAVIAVLRLILQFGVDKWLLPINPAMNPDLFAVKSRTTVWLDSQIDEFCKTARELGRPSLALAVLLGAGTGQREGDLRTLTWSQYDGEKLRFRQSKTGVAVEVRLLEGLKGALDSTVRKSPIVLISEKTGRPYNQYNFPKDFREVANAAGLPTELRFMDLRRTTVGWLAKADCTIGQIVSITGHSISRADEILEVYLIRNNDLADQAMAKLAAYRNRTKV